MTIAYELTDEDVVETGIYRVYGLTEIKKAVRRMRVALLLFVGVFLFLQFLLWGTAGHHPPFILFMLFPFLMGSLLTSPYFQRAALRGQIKNKKQAHLFRMDKGRRTVTARPDGLFVSAEGLSDTLIQWDAIETVTAEKNHLFIKWAGAQIVTIPRRTFAGVLDEAAFLEEIGRYRAALPPLPALLSTTPAVAAPIITAPVVAVTMTPTTPTVTATTPAANAPQTNNTPWWQGQTIASIETEAKANVNQRNGG